MSKRKKRIAICGAQIPFNYGGAEILIDELNRQLNLRDFQSEIINIPFKWYPKEQLIDNAMVWKLLDLTESNGEKIDQVICTKYPTYVVNHPNKVVWLFHQHRAVYDLLDTNYTEFTKTGDDLKIINHIRQIDNRTLTEAKKIYCISKNVANRLKEFNGIESEVLYPPTKMGESYKQGDFGKYIFSAGRLDPLKRVELIIQALNEIDQEYKLLIAGKGKHEEILKKVVEQEKVSDRVEFLGFVSDDRLLEYYSNASMIFFAPKDEDYGFITIEAFKSGKPVITTNDSGGVLEFVRHNENGMIANANAKDIAAVINSLIAQPDRLKELGKQGIETVRDINWDFVINSLVID